MRYRSVIDMHVVNRMQAFGWPPIIGAFALLIVLCVGAIVGTQGEAASAAMNEGMIWSGAIFAILGPMIGYGFTSMGQYFPLALGLGLTRKEFAGGVSIVFLASALLYSVVITLGKIIEVATGGFGLQVRFFDVAYTGTGPAWQTLIQTFLLISAALFVGAAITSAFLRFGQPFLWTGGAVLSLVVLALVAGIVLVDGFGRALLNLLDLGWWSGMGVIAAVTVGAAGIWLILVRRTQLR